MGLWEDQHRTRCQHYYKGSRHKRVRNTCLCFKKAFLKVFRKFLKSIKAFLEGLCFVFCDFGFVSLMFAAFGVAADIFEKESVVLRIDKEMCR